ncbi:MAG TPA: TonB-dependent receptor [Opitutaceae bacterium]|nr:TonB-dependent receptor [Opitutaceae bacterium]
MSSYLMLVFALGASAQSTGNGTLRGRVFDSSAGNYVSNARVIVESLGVSTFTNEFGEFVISNVPAGDLSVKVFYTGFPEINQVVAVPAGSTVEQTFNLSVGPAPTPARGDDTVKLEQFTVATSREMAASDVAVNEQRFSASIKNVVATDSFADIADGNVGEFAKFLPGVTLNRSGSDGVNISVGGVPPSGTPIMVDGASMASAASSNASRTVEFENISITSMSRVEVSRSPTPDAPASAIGGSVNLISKSAFERAKPQYMFRTYGSFWSEGFKFGKRPGPFNGESQSIQPNFDFSAVVPVNKKFGFTVTGLMTSTFNNGPGSTQDWVPNILAQSTNYPATTPDKPYLARYRVQERPKISKRQSGTVSMDWRISPTDVLTIGMQYAYFSAEFWVRQLNFDVGRVATPLSANVGDDFTQGAPGAGFAQIVTDARDKAGTTYMPSFRYKHTGPVWEWQVRGAFARASNHYHSKGYFQANNAYFRNLTVRFEGMGFEHPEKIIVTDAAGNAVNPYSLSNYRLEGVTGLQYDSSDIVRTLNTYAQRTFDLKIPVLVKFGMDIRGQTRDIARPTYAGTFVGADGQIRTADDNAYQFYEPIYSQVDLLYGPRMQWMDLYQIGTLYKTNPSYFQQTDANLYAAYRSQVTTSQAITETILAPYIRFDTKVLRDRLHLMWGVRFEHTEDDANGPLIDPTAIYQRDSNGNVIRVPGPNNTLVPAVVAPLNSLAGSRLAYIERGSKINESYEGYFPSFNATYYLQENLLARVAYGRSINRPDFDEILPSMSLPDSETGGRTITLANPALKPWIADSYSAALEYYFNPPSSGVLSARGYLRDIKDFWGTQTVAATPDLLEPYGIDPNVFGADLGYLVNTTFNVGDARVSGMEFEYRQNLGFLPHWARGLTVFANTTHQHLEGSEMASFTGFVGKTTNYGVAFSRSRFNINVAVNMRGLVKQARITNAGTEPGTFTYLLPRTSADLSAAYRLTRHLSVFVTGRNINKEVDYTVTYGPNTPRDRILRSRAGYGATWYVGIKGVY